MKLNRGHRRKRIVNDLAGEGHTIEEEKQSRYFSVDLAAVIWERDSEDESYDARGEREMSNASSIRRSSLAFGCLLSLGSLLGCGFYADRHVTLTPPAAISSLPVSSSLSVEKKVISVARPRDLRTDPTSVGVASPLSTPAIRSNTDVPMWVANSIILRLEQAGFTVERVETVETAPTSVVLDIAVLRVFASILPGVLQVIPTSHVAAEVEVYQDGRRIFRRTYVGKVETSELFVSTAASTYQALLYRILGRLFKKANQIRYGLL